MSWVHAATFFLSGLSIGANAVVMLFLIPAAKEAERRAAS